MLAQFLRGTVPQSRMETRNCLVLNPPKPRGSVVLTC
jgi:hypothetical protein